jgi:hypothetical protein
MAKAKPENPAPVEQKKSAPKAAAAAAKPTVSKPVAKAKKPQKPAGSAPLIDTSLAAKAAAKLVANRDMLARAGDKRGGGSFKLKEQLLKPATQGAGGLLQSPEAQKKFNPIPGRNQVGHNQTFGADVNRTGVPRRTGG